MASLANSANRYKSKLKSKDAKRPLHDVGTRNREGLGPAGSRPDRATQPKSGNKTGKEVAPRCHSPSKFLIGRAHPRRSLPQNAHRINRYSRENYVLSLDGGYADRARPCAWLPAAD